MESDANAELAVSVIIPVRDDAPRLARCLDALDAQTFGLPFEVIVIDNGSRDDPASVVAAHPRARMLSEARPSSYAARNAGVRAARGRVFAFTDSDCLPHVDWLESGAAAVVSRARPAFVAGRVDVFVKDEAHPTATELFDVAQGFPQRWYIENGSYGVTANLFVSADAFHSVGPFREALVSSGDREWGQRAADHGLEPVYADDVVVRHPARRSFHDLRRKARRIQVGLGQLRDERAQTLRVIDVLRALRPPLRSATRGLSRLPRHDTLSVLRYTVVAVSVHYVHAYEQLRVVIASRYGRRGR
jgi:glycosyltransferase involved in cell wall biosynthesis